MGLSNKKIDNNEKTIIRVSEDNIRRPAELGFHWEVSRSVPMTHSTTTLRSMDTVTCEDRCLGRWCSNARRSKKMMDNNKAPIIRVSEDNIRVTMKSSLFELHFE